MKYTVHSEWVTELVQSPPRFVRYPILSRAWRVVLWILLPLSYLGAFFAPMVVFGMPFGILLECEAPLWLTTAFMCAFVLWIPYRAARCIFYCFRQRVIHVEAIVVFVGVVLAFLAFAWVYPQT